MFKKEFSCGYTAEYSKKEVGISFKCSKCNNIHSFPIPPDLKSKKKESTFVKVRNYDSNWTLFWDWCKRFFSFKNWFASKKQIVDTTYEVLSSTTNPPPIITQPQRHRDTDSYPSAPNADTNPKRRKLYDDLSSMLNELILSTWRKQDGPRNISLLVSELDPPNWDQCIRKMLKHAESVAPKLKIPLKIPELIFKDVSNDSGGTFQVNEEGAVLITIKKSLCHDYKVALAVLSHELCHYILGSNLIKKDDTLLNEKMTDVCMFVLGFGELFMRGQQDIAGTSYGYLKPIEYQMILSAVHTRWHARNYDQDIISKVQELEKWIISAVYKGDKSRFEYGYNYMKKKYPRFSKQEILDKLKYDFLRDN